MWPHLPDEVLLHILSYLTPHDLNNCALVNEQWHDLSQDTALWRRIDLQDLPNLTENGLLKLADKQPHITHLRARECMIEEQYLNTFCVRAKSLTHLDLSFCHQTSSVMLSVLAEHCLNLEHLNVSGVMEVDDVGIIQLSSCHALHSLLIANCDSITDNSLSILAEARPLQLLDTSSILNIRAGTIRSLIQYCTHSLHTLHLDGGNLPEESVTLISKLSNLHTLSVQYCDEFSEIESLSDLKKLRKLKLCRGYSFTTDDIVHLAMSLEHLTHLHLTECNRVGDAALRAIGQHLKHLTHLNISWSSGFGEIGVTALLRHAHTLQHLTMKGLRGLHTCTALIPIFNPRLRLLDMSGCQNPSHFGLRVIAKDCPLLKIYGPTANLVTWTGS